ncbi:MAG: DUF3348 family protein [Comamonadaceae bacterium]|nr:MAG: DUF3348 family protein [Comamonadaceae bacterium]
MRDPRARGPGSRKPCRRRRGTVFLRSSFSQSSLVHLLGAWAPAEAPASGMDVAERLSLWVNAFDAIRLQSAQQAIAGIRTAAAGKPAAGRQDLAEDVRRVRSVLARAIAQEVDVDADGYAPYRRRHQDLQRQMELMIGPLRDHVRQALSRMSPALRQLAAMDALMEELLAPRAHALLPTAAALVERRFLQLQLQQQHLDDSGGGSDDAGDRWRKDFENDWRQALLAELDLRLEPVTGLVEALAGA